MSFLSSLASKIKESQSTANPYGSVMGIKVPTFSLGTDGFFGTEEVEGLGGLAKSITQSAQNILYSARLVGCLGTLLTDPEALFGALNQIIGSVGGMAAQMGERVLRAVQNQINLITGQIKGTIVSSILSIFGFLFAAAALFKAVCDLIDYLSSLSINEEEFWLSKEECSQMFGFIGSCLLNKYFGSTINSFTNSVVSKIDKFGSEVNAEISNELNDVTVVKNYVDNQTFMLKKATTQINGFRFQ